MTAREGLEILNPGWPSHLIKRDTHPASASAAPLTASRARASSSASQIGRARGRVGLPDRHNRLIFRAIIPIHCLFLAVELNDDDTASKASPLDALGSPPRTRKRPPNFRR